MLLFINLFGDVKLFLGNYRKINKFVCFIFLYENFKYMCIEYKFFSCIIFY